MVRIDKLGELTRGDQFPWLISGEIDVPFFPGKRLRVVLEDLETDDRPDELASAVARFLALTTRDRDRAAPYVFALYREMCEGLDEHEIEPKFPSPADVWRYVYPTEIRVSRRHRGDQQVYARLNAECEWEPEHGLQLVYRDGYELRRVSTQDGHLRNADAHGSPESEDRIV
jgi:hypothetical protein